MVTISIAIVLFLASWLLGFDVAFPSMLMGIGIAIDVVLATVSKFRDSDMSFKNWTLPIMATHIGLPAIGYYGFWGLTQKFPLVGPTFGIIGAILVTLFIYEVFSDWIGHEPIFGISNFISKVIERVTGISFDEGSTRRAVAIMAVSWDALWSGPAKAAQATSGNWTAWEVSFSFIIAGLVVAIAAQAALKLAVTLRRRKFSDVKKMATYSTWGKFVETSVIGGFGILSLSQGLEISDNIYQSIGVAAIVMGTLFLIFRARIGEGALEEAQEAIAGDE